MKSNSSQTMHLTIVLQAVMHRLAKKIKKNDETKKRILWKWMKYTCSKLSNNNQLKLPLIFLHWAQTNHRSQMKNSKTNLLKRTSRKLLGRKIKTRRRNRKMKMKKVQLSMRMRMRNMQCYLRKYKMTMTFKSRKTRRNRRQHFRITSPCSLVE